jgi:hypothetical protein
MPVIPVDRVVDKKRIIRKREDRGGGDAQGVADPKNFNFFTLFGSTLFYHGHTSLLMIIIKYLNMNSI